MKSAILLVTPCEYDVLVSESEKYGWMNHSIPNRFVRYIELNFTNRQIFHSPSSQSECSKYLYISFDDAMRMIRENGEFKNPMPQESQSLAYHVVPFDEQGDFPSKVYTDYNKAKEYAQKQKDSIIEHWQDGEIVWAENFKGKDFSEELNKLNNKKVWIHYPNDIIYCTIKVYDGSIECCIGDCVKFHISRKKIFKIESPSCNYPSGEIYMK